MKAKEKTKKNNKMNVPKKRNNKTKQSSKNEKKELAAFYDQMSTDLFPFGGKIND